jgi:hypothetical protein
MAQNLTHQAQPRQRDRRARILAILIVIALAILLSPASAIASVHRYPLPDGSVMERSLQTLRDDRDRGWQVVLFQARGATPRLRVVGFPGVQIDRTVPIALARRDGWLTQSARDSFEFVDLAPNTAEYELPDVAELLAGDRTLDLTIPLGPSTDAPPSTTTETPTATITLPPFVIREWQEVIATQP